MNRIPESELIINPNNSIYHLHLVPEQLAGTIILVGDPGRVDTIASYLDRFEFRVCNREYISVGGTLGNHRLNIISTGMGTDNIDIVLNELDALANIDFTTRTIKSTHRSLNLIRLGTCGGLQHDLEVDTLVASQYGLGLDGLLRFYDSANFIDEEISEEFIKQSTWPETLAKPYVVKGSEMLLQHLGKDFRQGITATSCGFYGPQGRKLRLSPVVPDIEHRLQNFSYKGMKILNLEMETSALYGLGGLMGHNTLTICAVIANRIRQEYSRDYKKTVQKMIEQVLQKIQSMPN